MVAEKIIEYPLWAGIIISGLSLGFRVGEIASRSVGNEEGAKFCRLIAIGTSGIGLRLAALDLGITIGVNISGTKMLFGELASFGRFERVASYFLALVNSFVAFQDTT